jgi:hypothetical protein
MGLVFVFRISKPDAHECAEQNRGKRENDGRCPPTPKADQKRRAKRNNRRADVAGGEVGGQSGSQLFLVKVMGKEGASDWMLRRTADPGHNGPKEKLMEALRQTD